MKPSSSMLIALLLAACGEPTLPALSDTGASGECRDALLAWDARHPLPDNELSVILEPSLATGAGGTAPDLGADGDRATVGTGEVGSEIVLELITPTDVRGIRHYPPSSGDGISHYEVYLGDDTGCDELAGDVVVDLGPFNEDAPVTPRVASRVRIVVRGVHGGGREYAVSDFQILAGADFETLPVTSAQAGTVWTWHARAQIPGVGPTTFALTTAPPGMTVDAEGLLSWTPHISEVGDHMVNIIARRGEASIERRFVLAVHE